MRKILGCWFVWMSLCVSGYAATLDKLSVSNRQGETQIELRITGSFEYTQFQLKSPERVVIDLKHTTASSAVQKAIGRVPSGPSIKKIRYGYPQENQLRLVFETLPNTQMQESHTAHGLVLRFSAAVAHSSSKKNQQTRPAAAVTHKKLPRDVVVVIDPGHGGKDPGAIGPNRHLEKNIVLAIARELKKKIDKTPGMRAVLTRDGDYYVDLRQRLAIARKHNADLFISIHADAFVNRESQGASVFALSQGGATSEAARWLAEKENNSELGGVNLAELDDKNGLIRTVLLDLSQTATISSSLNMGGYILKNLGSMTRLHHHKVEQAQFVVLKSPDIPSILIETGFISNPREERNLVNSAYQQRLAQSILNGLSDYVKGNTALARATAL